MSNYPWYPWPHVWLDTNRVADGYRLIVSHQTPWIKIIAFIDEAAVDKLHEATGAIIAARVTP